MVTRVYFRNDKRKMFPKRIKQPTDLRCQIILNEAESVSDCCHNSTDSSINGAFIITTTKPTEIYGFGVGLEGRARAVLLRKSKGGERAEYRRSEYYFLDLPFQNFELSENNVNHLVTDFSLVNEFSNHELTWKNQRPMRLKEGKQVYKFNLNLKESLLNCWNNQNQIYLPTSFKHDFGSIQYFLTIYMKVRSKSNFIKICERILPPSLVSPMIQIPPKIINDSDESSRLIVKRREGSQRDTFIEGQFKLNDLNYLPGENIEFNLIVQNQCDSFISKMSVFLIQKLAFRAGGFMKSCHQNLINKDKVKHELMDMMKTGNFFVWENYITIPSRHVMPSFKTDEKCLEIFYFVQFIVTLTGNGTLTGEIPITIGTFRQSEDRSSNDPCTCHDLAPAYSQLSIETLPPSYEETLQKFSGMSMQK